MYILFNLKLVKLVSCIAEGTFKLYVAYKHVTQMDHYQLALESP